jgi:peptidyl-prolyl cis-trans isomerase C
MKLHALVATAVVSTLLLGGCNNNTGNNAQTTPSSTPKPAPEDTFSVVNGQPISKAALQVMTDELTQAQGGQKLPEDKLIEQLVARELLRQEAETLGLAKDPVNAARIEHHQRMLLSQIAAESFMKNATISDEVLKQEYDRRVSEVNLSEYKARHILVEKEAEAKDILQKLQKGGKFEDLAKKFSKDTGSQGSGGDLGWFDSKGMVEPFAKAVAGLKKGETTSTPVQTEYGWHIIRLDDSRKKTPPPFEEVKEQIRNRLQATKLQEHIEELKKSAKIEQMTPPAKKEETPAASPAAPTATDGSEQKPPETSLEAGKPK